MLFVNNATLSMVGVFRHSIDSDFLFPLVKETCLSWGVRHKIKRNNTVRNGNRAFDKEDSWLTYIRVSVYGPE